MNMVNLFNWGKLGEEKSRSTSVTERALDLLSLFRD